MSATGQSDRARGDAPRTRRPALNKAVKRPAAWRPATGVKMSRNQIFLHRRRAVEQYAHYLGLDLRLDGELLWLAEEGLYAPVPEGYTEMLDLHGTPYYYHIATRSVSWEHPLDAEYRLKLRGMRSIHDLADPSIGKIRTWLQGQARGNSKTDKDTTRRGRTRVQRVLQLVTGTLLFCLLAASLVYVAMQVWKVRQLMYVPGPILAQVAGALGSAGAAFEAGLTFHHGHGVIPRNTSQALSWFLLAGELGDVRGLRMAASVLFKGEGEVQADAKRAAILFRDAAAAGDAFSQSYYGLLQYQGSGVPQNEEGAVVWTKLGAEAGDATGMLVFGVMHLEGRALSRDTVTAYKWLLLAEKYGHADSYVTGKVKSYIEYAYTHLGPEQRIEAQRAASAFESLVPPPSRD